MADALSSRLVKHYTPPPPPVVSGFLFTEPPPPPPPLAARTPYRTRGGRFFSASPFSYGVPPIARPRRPRARRPLGVPRYSPGLCARAPDSDGRSSLPPPRSLSFPLSASFLRDSPAAPAAPTLHPRHRDRHSDAHRLHAGMNSCSPSSSRSSLDFLASFSRLLGFLVHPPTISFLSGFLYRPLLSLASFLIILVFCCGKEGGLVGRSFSSGISKSKRGSPSGAFYIDFNSGGVSGSVRSVCFSARRALPIVIEGFGLFSFSVLIFMPGEKNNEMAKTMRGLRGCLAQKFKRTLLGY